jgi:predicted Na+-dependent transporter
MFIISGTIANFVEDKQKWWTVISFTSLIAVVAMLIAGILYNDYSIITLEAYFIVVNGYGFVTALWRGNKNGRRQETGSGC